MEANNIIVSCWKRERKQKQFLYRRKKNRWMSTEVPVFFLFFSFLFSWKEQAVVPSHVWLAPMCWQHLSRRLSFIHSYLFSGTFDGRNNIERLFSIPFLKEFTWKIFFFLLDFLYFFFLLLLPSFDLCVKMKSSKTEQQPKSFFFFFFDVFFVSFIVSLWCQKVHQFHHQNDVKRDESLINFLFYFLVYFSMLHCMSGLEKLNNNPKKNRVRGRERSFYCISPLSIT